MAEFIAGGYDFSPLISDNAYSVKKTNIYEDIPGYSDKIIAGERVTISLKLSEIKEPVISAIKEALSSEEVPVTYTFCGDETEALFPRPEIEITAVSEHPDGIYWDVLIKFMSDGFYPDDCL